MLKIIFYSWVAHVFTCLVFSVSQPRCSQEPVASALVRHDAIRMVSAAAVIVIVLA